MCCILPVMHLNASLCIPVHLGGKIPDFDERRGVILLASWCLRMHMNAHECTRMRQNAPEYTRDHTHTYTREAGADSRPNSHGRIWAGRAGRAIRRAIRAPMCHYMSSKSSSNAYTSEHTRVNASAYTSECVCEWMHLNALECVRMRVRQNATCRQNATYVGRHTNAFECNSCRMQRTANAQ